MHKRGVRKCRRERLFSIKKEAVMIIQSLKRSTLFAAALSLAGVGYSADVKWYDAVTIGGHVQASYNANLSKSLPQTNQLRGYDSHVNTFSLNQFQLKIGKALAGDDKYGFGAKLLMGRDAGVIKSFDSSNTTTGAKDFDVQEAYGLFKCPWTGTVMTAGKFVTSMGIEVIESPANNQVSPGLLFFNGMPYTHTGLKGNYALNDRLNFTAGVVNGWDYEQDNNDGKTIIWQVATTPMAGAFVNFQGTYGPEKNTETAGPPPVNGNGSKRSALDLTLGTTVKNITLMGEALYGQDSNVRPLGGTKTGDVHWSGYGLWIGTSLSSYLNPSARFEIFEDNNGADKLGRGKNNTAKTLTLTNKFKVTDNAFTRLEYRHDFSNEAVYTRNNGSNVRTQNTIGIDWVVTF